jgi:asparagine synthase (glutamine-hydrolysing)
MCGIVGIFRLNGEQGIRSEQLQSMIKKLYHRGPDGTGAKYLDNTALGHARLSIIDLTTGDQPIHNEDKSIWTVFNGEIFNFIELREMLTKKGHVFYTQSDTEVIVHLYEEYGDDFVNHLNGQFAIAIYDNNKNRLLLVRDRIGIAPLYYTIKDSILYFASEVKSLLVAYDNAPELNHNALDQIFTFWSPVSPETIFKNIYEVSPGQMIVCEKGNIKKQQYWDWKFPVNDSYLEGDDAELAEELRELLIDATRIRLRSDVPVGAYLSGGLDSSTIVSLIHNYTNNDLRTFSIGFDEGSFDETGHQNTLVEKYHTNHSYLKCSNSDIANDFLDTIWHTESPILRTAPVPMRRLSGLVRQNNYKVVLTGEGADEVLGGYDIFKEAKIRRFWSKYPESRMRPALLKRLYPYLDMSKGAYLNAFFGQGMDEPEHFSFSHMTRWNSTAQCKEFFSNDTKHRIEQDALNVMSETLPVDFTRWHHFNQAQYIEAKSLMGGYLLCSQGDRMLMSNSVEGRFPFLDHRIIEFANKLHPKTKMRGLNEKFLLKKAMKDELPESIVDRHKQPYRAPNIPAFFNDRTNEYVRELLSEGKLKSSGYFNSDKVSRLLKKIEKGRAIGNKDNMALVGILSTQVWHKHFVEDFYENFKNESDTIKNEKVKNVN